MLDKKIIGRNFEKSILTYNSNAIVQKKMAQKLVSLIEGKKFQNILEIGSFTGLLTSLAVREFDFETYLAIDIVDSFSFIKPLNSKLQFIQSDIEKIEFKQKFDLIISSATLQWCNDFEGVLSKLLNSLNLGGILAFSTFGEKNLFEIKKAFGLSLNYKSKNEIEKMLPNAFVEEDLETLEFQSSLDVLKHLKFTGVNSLNNEKMPISKLRQGLKLLGLKLTYNPLYVVVKN